MNLAAAVAAAGGDPQNEVDYGDYAARLQLDYRMSDSTLLFASYNRGIKGGNFAPSANVTLDQIRHEEEVLDAFELGVKTEFSGWPCAVKRHSVFTTTTVTIKPLPFQEVRLA